MTFEDTYDNNASLAAEYVLGTLSAEERAQALSLIETDAAFAAEVHYWERRLGELHVMVEAVEPPSEVWQSIARRIEGASPSGDIVLPRVAEPPPFDLTPTDRNIILLRRRVRRWRDSAFITGALAAGLAAFLITSAIAPDLLPERLRLKPRVIEVAKSDLPSRFVAVLQRDSTSPAFILTVDIESRNLTVRRVSADAQPGKSYELWLVSDRLPAPRSLGVVGDREFTIDRKLAAFDPATISDATFAVTLEPEGGSPTGAPTSDVLWAGKLVQSLPGARTQAPSRSP
jgi:anti-sigma-K factor RskA